MGTIPDDVTKVFVNEYKNMRSMGMNKKTITATPRQLESLIRISESLAKMRLSPCVETKDVEEAVRLIRTAMQQSAVDPKTGTIDMDIIQTGITATSTERVKVICEYIKKVQRDFADKVMASGVKYSNLLDFLQQKVSTDAELRDFTEILEQEFRDALLILEGENVISMVGHKRKPTIRFIA